MDIRERLKAYTEQDDRVGAASFFGTFGVYFLSLYLAIYYLDQWVIHVPAGIVSAFAAVRLYVLQHDAGHGTLFSKRWMNFAAGHVLSVWSMAPFTIMRHNHNLHHAHVGNLEERDTGEIHTMTVAEWQAADWKTRLAYRLYRNPFILIPLGSAFTYFIRYRWPKNAAEIGLRGLALHNLALIAWVSFLYFSAGWAGVFVWLGWGFVGGMIGVFLVYLQHNFEDTHWDRKPSLNPRVAALEGASALDLGWWMDLGSANISYHDIHHFNARIPHYNLRRCHRDIRAEYGLRVIRWPEAIRSFTLKLWDEDQKRLVPFPKPGRSGASVAAQS